MVFKNLDSINPTLTPFIREETIMKKWQFICFACLLNSFSGTWATEKNTNLIINGSFEAADCGSYITLSPREVAVSQIGQLPKEQLIA